MTSGLASMLRRWRYADAALWRGMLRALFGGDRFHCSVCDSDARLFLPLPALYSREMARSGFPHRLADFETLNVTAYTCPICGASDRDRFIAAYVDAVVIPGLPDDARVVDIAPAQGLSAFLRKRLPASTRYLRVDKFSPNVDLAADICDMPEIGSDSTRFWICSHVLEHVEDDALAAGELFRILTPGGLGIVLAPVLMSDDSQPATPALTELERWRRFGQGDHVRLYTRRRLIDLLSSAGFSLAVVQASEFLGSRADAFGIQPRATLYVVSKPAITRA